jgi:hypothetical protein
VERGDRAVYLSPASLLCPLGSWGSHQGGGDKVYDSLYKTEQGAGHSCHAHPALGAPEPLPVVKRPWLSSTCPGP